MVKLDGAELNDFPAIYSVPTLRPYEFAAVGIWIHPNIVPGFKYKVRPIEDKEVSSKTIVKIKTVATVYIVPGANFQNVPLSGKKYRFKRNVFINFFLVFH